MLNGALGDNSSEGWGALVALTHTGSSDRDVPRAAQSPTALLTCSHESILAIAVIDIALLLWKKKGGCEEAGCQAGAGELTLLPTKGGAEQQGERGGGWRKPLLPWHCTQTQVRSLGKNAKASAHLGRSHCGGQQLSISPKGCSGRHARK